METDKTNHHLYDIIIIGGGISGISFAHKMLQKSNNILLLEKEDRIGGQIYSHASTLDPSFWSEMGAHSCYNSYIRLLSMVKDLHLEEHIQPLGKCKYKLYSDGKIVNPMSKVSILSLLIHGPQIYTSTREGKTVKEYFKPIVGRGNYDQLFSKMFRAVISQDADNYPAELFLKGRKERWKQFPRKYSFAGGLSTFLEQTAERNRINYLKGEEANKVSFDNQIYTVVTQNGKSFQSKQIAFATSPNITSRLLKDIEPEVAKLLQTIPVIESCTLNITVRKDLLHFEPVAGIIPLSENFYSAVSRDSVEHATLRAFSFHYKGHQKVAQMIHIACKVLGIHDENIEESVFTSHILPSPQIQHLNMSEQVEKIRHHESIYILGNYFYGLSIEDCIHRSFDEYDRLSNQQIGMQ